MNAAEVRALYGKPANRQAMLDAIAAMDTPSWAGILYIPDLLTGDHRVGSPEYHALVAELTESMTRNICGGIIPEIRIVDTRRARPRWWWRG